MHEVVISVSSGFRLSKAAAMRISELLDDENLDIGYEFDFGASILERTLPRHNPALVQTVKELGGKAHAKADRLLPSELSGDYDMYPFKIVKVEDEYNIDEYDGCESVQEPHKIRWTKASDLSSLKDTPFYLWKEDSEEYKTRRQAFDRKRKREEEKEKQVKDACTGCESMWCTSPHCHTARFLNVLF